MTLLRFSTLPAVAEGRRRAAELLVQCLEHEGVTFVFGVPGEGSLWENDSAVGYWAEISAPGGFKAISATQNATGQAVG